MTTRQEQVGAPPIPAYWSATSLPDELGEPAESSGNLSQRENLSVSPPCVNHRFFVVAAVFVLVSALFVAWMLIWSGRRATDDMDNVVQLLVGFVATALCAIAAIRRKQRFQGWALLAAALFVAVCGNGIWSYYALVRGELLSASVAGDVCTALALPLAVAGVLSFGGVVGTAASHVRVFLDTLLVATGTFFIGWTLVLGPMYHRQSGGLAVTAFNLAYPSSDIVIASLVIVLATRASSRNRVSLALVSLGLVSFAVADSSFSYLMAVHRYGLGNATDTGWVVGYLLIALGALWAWDHPLGPGAILSRPTVRTLVGPNLPLVGVALTALWQVHAHHSLDRVSEVALAAVVITMASRQLLVLLDHLALSHQLELKVEQRTSELQYQAFHDGLTGLANRAMFTRQLDATIKAHDGTCDGLAVLLIDLHNFKRVNDLHGHPIGDELLRLVAERLQASLRASDTIARVGGDEFAILLQAPEGHEPESVARLVIETLAQPFPIGSLRLSADSAVGLAIGGQGQTAGDELLLDAGLALCAAKAKGGPCFEVYAPVMYTSVLESLKTEADIREALERGEFVVYYQPVVDLATIEILGLEALVRWNHPERGFLGPDKFIPVAEATGIIGALGAWVLGQACSDISAMDAEKGSLWISVNLSALQLEDEHLIATVSQALARSGLDAARLKLEVTESVLMNDVPRAVQVLTALRNLGVKIAIDDFGTGYSSLGALRYLPVDTLKIDRSFVTDLAHDRASADLTRRTLQLAADFHLETVAEGVEEVEQLELLRAFGCDAVQGFLFAKPQPLAEVLILLDKGLRPPAPPPFTAIDGGEAGPERRRTSPNEAGQLPHRSAVAF